MEFFLPLCVTLAFLTSGSPVMSASDVAPTSNFVDGQTINMVLTADALEGKQFLKGTINPQSTVKVVLNDSAVISVGFGIFQVHSYIIPVSLSYDAAFTNSSTVNGTDGGLFFHLNVGLLTFYIHNVNKTPVDLLLLPIVYQNGKPVPGGCNLSFNVEIAPYMTMTFDSSNSVIQINAQEAAASEQGGACGLPSNLVYDVYELGFQDTSKESYFNAVLSMATVNGAVQNGKLIRKPTYGSLLKRRLAAYLGFGKVFVVTVKSSKTNLGSAYVPISSYYCINENRAGCYLFQEFDWLLGIFCATVLASLAVIVFLATSRRDFGVPFQAFIGFSSLAYLILSFKSMSSPVLTMAAVLTLICCLSICCVSIKVIAATFVYFTLPLASAHISFGLLVWFGLGNMAGFDVWYQIAITFGVYVLAHFTLQMVLKFLQPDWRALESVIASFALLSVISYWADNGVLFYLFLDPVRTLTPQLSGVTFSISDYKAYYFFAAWPFLTCAYILVFEKLAKISSEYTPL